MPIFQAEDWTEANAGNIPGDRRGVIMSGPFTFGPGERQTLHLAYVTAKANEGGAWASVELMQQGVDQVRRQYERDTTDSERSFYYIPQNGQMVGIAEAQPKQELKVYPNPTTGVVHLATTTSERLTAELYDLMGHRIGSYSIVGGEGTIDLITLPQGFYILRCNGQVHRIIKK